MGIAPPAVVCLILGACIIAVVCQIEASVGIIDQERRAGVRAEVLAVASALSAHPTVAAAQRIAATIQDHLTLLAADGSVLYDSAPDQQSRAETQTWPEVQRARHDGIGVSLSANGFGDQAAAAVRLGRGLVVRIEVIGPSGRGGMLTIALSTVILVLLSGLIVSVQIWRSERRLDDLVEVSRAFATGEFTRRASLEDEGAIGRFGRELNALGEALRDSHAALGRGRSLLDGALGALGEGVACIDHLDKVVYANPTYRRLAAGGGEVLGQPFYEHLPALALGRDPWGEAGRRADRDREVGADELPLDPDSDEIIEFEHRRRRLRATTVPGGEGILVLVLYDLTEISRLEHAQRDFISAVSHEFKTPLTAIIGFTDTLLDGVIEQDPATARSFVERIARHSDRLGALVNDVLTLSRLEQGGWANRPEPFDLILACRSVLDDYHVAAGQSGVNLQLQGPQTLKIVADPELVRELIGNLVSNAVRYNRPQGSVWIDVGLSPADRVLITVRDTGIGIPAEHQSRIFDRFYRVDSHRSRQTGGTGLGLAIVKHIVGLLQAGISLESGAEGTRFTVDMPRGSTGEVRGPVNAG